MKIKKSFIVVGLIGILFYLGISCMDSGPMPLADKRGISYSGSASCQNCHQEIFDSYQRNEHFHTSWPVRKFPGDIQIQSDSFIYNEHNKVVIEHRDSGIFQVAYTDEEEILARKFDIAFGSGEKAYTFGYWQDKKLNQLPLSYFTTIHQWTNSPGFPAHAAYFERPIIRRCMECHSSYVAASLKQTESLSNVRNLDSASIIYGIDCERCHGPGAEHVKFQQENPAEKQSRYIARWQSLSRQQKLDACGVCHSGNDLATQITLFAFKPGDTLSNFYYPDLDGTASTPDVHGKQVQLLSASQCFIQSKTMECSSCHLLHGKKINDLSPYVASCQKCHQQIKHASPEIKAMNEHVLTSSCIDCHMPSQVSKAISFREKGQDRLSDYILRTHRIGIYPEATRQALTHP